MKKILALLLVFAFALSLCGCNNASGSTMLFDYDDLTSYAEFPEYKGYKFDSSKDDFIKMLTEAMQNELVSNKLQQETEVASGTVMDGDTAHIVYVGKIDGVEFSGGSTGDSGTDLVIGSGSYIEGFESGLIGKEIGSTVVLDLKFPETYHNADVAGKPVEFTVTIQTVKRTTYPEVTDDIAKKMGFESVDDYEKTVFAETARQYIMLDLVENTKVSKIPEKEMDFFVDTDIAYYKNYYAAMGATLESVTGMTEEQVRTQLKNNYKNAMSQFLLVYHIARTEGLTVSEKELNDKIAELAKDSNVSVEEFSKSNPSEYIELSMLYERVMDFVWEKAEIIETAE